MKEAQSKEEIIQKQILNIVSNHNHTAGILQEDIETQFGRLCRLLPDLKLIDWQSQYICTAVHTHLQALLQKRLIYCRQYLYRLGDTNEHP